MKMQEPNDMDTTPGGESAPETSGPEKTAPGKQSTPQDLQEWVITFNSTTGALVKVEKLDASGQRQELSQAEYSALFALDPSTLGAYGGYSAYGYDPYASLYAAYAHDPYGYLRTYYQEMADYATALGGATGSEYSPELAAYYRGMADAQAALGY